MARADLLYRCFWFDANQAFLFWFAFKQCIDFVYVRKLAIRSRRRSRLERGLLRSTESGESVNHLFFMLVRPIWPEPPVDQDTRAHTWTHFWICAIESVESHSRPHRFVSHPSKLIRFNIDRFRVGRTQLTNRICEGLQRIIVDARLDKLSI